MEIYVDKLPESCYECEFCGKFKAPAERPEVECMKCNLMKKFNTRYEQCPLKTIEEHDKEKDKLVANLQEQLENAIVPKFKIGQEVWYVSLTNNICKFKIIEIVFTHCADGREMVVYCDECCADMYEYELCATQEEAEQKLKELRGTD